MADAATLRGIIEDWIAASNAHDTAAYLAFFTDDPTIDDPSVGAVFSHLAGVRDYFETYVVGYNTQTRIVSVEFGADGAHVEVEFRGDFPERRLGGVFDLSFDGERIAFIRADLLPTRM